MFTDGEYTFSIVEYIFTSAEYTFYDDECKKSRGKMIIV